MTPKEKAKELVDKFYPILGGIEPKDWEYFCKDKAKQCALICINEMIRICYDHTMASYYGEVKQEIENL